jgi:predicted TIM-barrel fold metal-dependent hydrolase
MQKIDAHIHFVGDHPDAVVLLADLDLKLLNICVAHDNAVWRRDEAEPYERLARQHPDRFAWCTSFDVPAAPDDFRNPGAYAERVIAGLERDFSEGGALACKVWKNVGMEVRAPDSGGFVFVDDPLFDPIWAYLARANRPLLFHIGEPLACWQPLVPDTPHYGYYRQNPQWHMHGRSDFPAHADLIASWERLLHRHPDLRVVGAHLGSLEYDVAEVARRLDRFPNLAVDISARIGDLAFQDSEIVRQFFLAYADRVLFGTDLVYRRSQAAMADDERRAIYAAVRAEYQTHFAYFEGRGPVRVRRRDTQGLDLPVSVLDRFYAGNARAWYPGL